MKCKYCNNEIQFGYSLDNEMKDTQTCIRCLHWVKFSYDIATDPIHCFVYHGQAYHAFDKPGFQGSGFGGSKWKVTYTDGFIYETKNLWHVGDVPSWFRPFLPDTIKELKEVW